MLDATVQRPRPATRWREADASNNQHVLDHGRASRGRRVSRWIAGREPKRLGLRDMERAKLKFGLLSGALAVLVFLLLFLNTISATLLGFFTGAVQHNSAEVLVYNVASRRNLRQPLRAPAHALDHHGHLEGGTGPGPSGAGRRRRLGDYPWHPGRPASRRGDQKTRQVRDHGDPRQPDGGFHRPNDLHPRRGADHSLASWSHDAVARL